MRTSEFTYHLPSEAIAQEPIEPRHAARLLDCRDMSDHTFDELPELLEPGDLVVVNHTRVRRARLAGQRRDTAGAVELLLLSTDGVTWEALARPSRRLRRGVVVDVGPLTATVMSGPEDGVVRVELVADGTTGVEDVIEQVGQTPLPPYFTGSLDDPERYQTIFAAEPASAAAPTAGLHFTDSVVSALADRDIEIASVGLDVGIDTFRPINAEEIDDHEMHSEMIHVDAPAVAAVAAARDRGSRVIAVGTTVVRTLESCANATGGLAAFDGSTDLFIRPGFEFRVVDGMITNFHVPGSTLIVLVAAFMGDGWRRAYEAAIDRKYRMLSFGDAMVVFR